MLVDEILAPYDSSALGFSGYKNHVRRLICFASELTDLSKDDRTMITIAACFHDLGLFTDNTFDYLPPSVAHALTYVRSVGLERWADQVATMIDKHHCIRKTEDRLTEVFRKADLIDFSLGLFKCGLRREQVRSIRSSYANLGFHRHVLRTAGRWIVRHPFDPVPVLKW